MSRVTGGNISDLDHLKQSILDLLSTSFGSRLIYRDYGASLLDRTDEPMNSVFLINLRSAITEAIEKYEPRIAIKSVEIPELDLLRGQISIRLVALYLPTGNIISIDRLDFTLS